MPFNAGAYSYIYNKPNSKLSIKNHTLAFGVTVSGYTLSSSLSLSGVGLSVKKESATKSILSISRKKNELTIDTRGNRVEGNIYGDLSNLFGPGVMSLNRLRWLELDGVSSVEFNNKLVTNSCHLNQYW